MSHTATGVTYAFGKYSDHLQRRRDDLGNFEVVAVLLSVRPGERLVFTFGQH